MRISETHSLRSEALATRYSAAEMNEGEQADSWRDGLRVPTRAALTAHSASRTIVGIRADVGPAAVLGNYR